MPKYLAIDYGTRRVGLAIASTSLAEPLTVLSYHTSAELLQSLWQIIQEEQPSVIVVGESEQAMAAATQQFVAGLRTHLQERLPQPPPIVLADETLSSRTVQDKLKAAGKHHISQQPIDHYAAAEFLQEYLDLHLPPETQ